MKRILAVTVGRSDFGIFQPVLNLLHESPDFHLDLVVAGAHLVDRFGRTEQEILAAGLPIADRVPMLLADDGPDAVARAMGLGMLGFASVYDRLRPDLVLVLGDRFEMHSAAFAAVPFVLPIGHIHGGEVTRGAIDDALRHSITKCSHLHFVSTADYARRVMQMGEEPWRVLISGAPALDHLRKIELVSRENLAERVGLPLEEPPILVTFHPVTLEFEETAGQVEELLAALSACDVPLILTKPNADTRHHIILEQFEAFVRQHPRAVLVDNLGTRYYFSAMRHARAMVGNSSSGIIEAASFGLPVVNIGRRQEGRTRGRNVLDVPTDRQAILQGIERALDPAFRESLAGMDNPYGDGRAAERIVDILRRMPLDRTLCQKQFMDLDPEAFAINLAPTPSETTEATAVSVPMSGPSSALTGPSLAVMVGELPPVEAEASVQLPVPASRAIPVSPTSHAANAGGVEQPRASNYVLLGGGGHAAVVLDAICAAGLPRPIGIIDVDPARWGDRVLDVPILEGGDRLLVEAAAWGITGFVLGVGSVRSSQLRQRLHDEAIAQGLRPLAVLHPTASIAPSAQLGAGCQVLAQAIIGPRAILGAGSLVNHAAIVDHDAEVGAFAHLAPRACLAGSVQLGRLAHVGSGAIVRQGVRIGEGATIGAGAVVVADVLENQVVVGVPAKPLERPAA